MSTQLELRFPTESADQAGRYARELAEDLRERGTGAVVELRKDDSTTQDLGATLLLILGTKAVLEISKGIASFLSRRRCKMEIRADGSVVFSGDSADAAKIAEALRSRAED